MDLCERWTAVVGGRRGCQGRKTGLVRCHHAKRRSGLAGVRAECHGARRLRSHTYVRIGRPLATAAHRNARTCHIYSFFERFYTCLAHTASPHYRRVSGKNGRLHLSGTSDTQEAINMLSMRAQTQTPASVTAGQLTKYLVKSTAHDGRHMRVRVDVYHIGYT